MKTRIVTLGGGNGQSELLAALDPNIFDITAIVSTADDGGSSAVLRDMYGIIPPGDLRRCLAALADVPQDLKDFWLYRFSDGVFAGHVIGNFVLANFLRTTTITRAMTRAEKLLHVHGHILPISHARGILRATYADGRVLISEYAIDTTQHVKLPITKLQLTKKIVVHPRAQKALHQANMIVLAMGDLYTSILPTLLVTGVPQAIAASRAHVIYIVNRTTIANETKGFTIADFTREVSRYILPARLHVVICDNSTIPLPHGFQGVPLASLPNGIRLLARDCTDRQHPQYLSGVRVARILRRLIK